MASPARLAPGPVVLRRIDRERAQAIVARRPPADERWADGYPTDGDVEAAEHLLRQLRGRADPGPFGVYEVLEAETGTAIGGIGFHRPPGRDGAVEVGYGLVVSVWNRGYATAALKQVIGIAAEGGASRLEARAVPDNLASRRVMEKCGLVFVDLVDGFVRYAITL